MSDLAERIEKAGREATEGPWEFDEPENWHGLAARVFHPNEGKYEPIAQVQLSGWPRKVGRSNAALIVLLRNNAALLCAALRENEARKKIIVGLEALCAAYRLGGHPTNKALDTLDKGRAELEALTEAPRRGA